MRSHAHRLGTDAAYDTFSVSNGCPQKQAFNGGHWLGLEYLTGRWANTYGKVWIVCGPIFENREPSKWIGDSNEIDVAVPDAFFKIVVRESSNPVKPHVLAFTSECVCDLEFRRYSFGSSGLVAVFLAWATEPVRRCQRSTTRWIASN